jgi:alkaline phosphatase D
LIAQIDQPRSFGKGAALYMHHRPADGAGPRSFTIPEWAPFYHGVASGDPLADRVILWTRVTPDSTVTGPVDVEWRVATDPALEQVVTSGTFTTTASRDYTVKVDATGLAPATTYYYGFTALGRHSLTGKTKTTPTGATADHLKFGVVSCANYQAGYFNAYASLARRTDLDAVIHLGDYIYEYGNFFYGSDVVWGDRPLEPATEIISLPDYRHRYSTYRLDTQLVRLHQQHPMIAVWDDHESANDSYVDGAENHNPDTEGSWAERKAAARRAYFEWMPIRETPQERIYRTFRYGDLVDLIMLDTRLEGRDRQPDSIADPSLNDPGRTMLGAEQKQWLLDQLAQSTARWKLIGQQVVFSEFNVGWAAAITGDSYAATESIFLDIWDGYPAERSQIVDYLETNGIDDVVLLTGDFHSSFAYDVADPPVTVQLDTLPDGTEIPYYLPISSYDPVTGTGSRAVEFATPSVTSANFDENTNLFVAQIFQNQINSPLTIAGLDVGNPNPHLKYTDLIQHGYYLLDVKPDSVQANYYYTPILEVNENANFGRALFSRHGDNHLSFAAGPSGPKAEQDTPAPADPPEDPNATAGPAPTIVVLSSYPNPTQDRLTLLYTLERRGDLRIELFDTAGRLVRRLHDQAALGAGLYSVEVSLAELPAGAYFVRLRSGAHVATLPVVKR